MNKPPKTDQTHPFTVRRTALLLACMLGTATAFSGLTTGAWTPAAMLGNYKSVSAGVADSDPTPRPATLDRVWAEPSWAGTIHRGRTEAGAAVSFETYEGELPGDRVCTTRQMGAVVVIDEPGPC